MNTARLQQVHDALQVNVEAWKMAATVLEDLDAPGSDSAARVMRNQAAQIDTIRLMLRDSIHAVPAPEPEPNPSPFQNRAFLWAEGVFDHDVIHDPAERGRRVLEEALELAQALGVSDYDARTLMAHIYTRTPGQPGTEIGDVMVALAVAATQQNITLEAAGEHALARCITRGADEILERHKRKPV